LTSSVPYAVLSPEDFYRGQAIRYYDTCIFIEPELFVIFVLLHAR
jgi:hypothetical protein